MIFCERKTSMNVKIGTIIKNLRKEHRVTQEDLAAAIGVTPQAVSRWEGESGYPDIELLPAIADFFAVSIDELIGYRQSEREMELTQIKKELARLKEVGTLDERVAFARNALIRFPGDDEIKESLAVSLFFIYDDRKDEAALAEAETLCKSVMESSTDLDMKYDAINTLISIYEKTGNIEKAYQTAQMLTPMKYCREFALSSGIGDSKTEWYIQDEIDKLADCLGTAIQNLVLNDDLPNDETTWDKKIKMLKTSNEIYRLIYGDDLMFYHERLSHNYWLLSTYLIAQGKTDEALDALEKMCEHAIAYDRSYEEDHGKNYSSIFTDRLVYPEPGKVFQELTEHNQSYYKLDCIKSPRYDCIRDNKRFVAVVSALEKKAR